MDRPYLGEVASHGQQHHASSIRRSTSRVQLVVEITPGNSPYARSQKWGKRLMLMSIILLFLSTGYGIMTIILTIMYIAAHWLIWFVNLICSFLLLWTSFVGIASTSQRVKRSTQFKLSIVFAIGLCLFLSAQLFMGLTASRGSCLRKRPKQNTETNDPPEMLLDICTMIVEAIVIYTTIIISILYFSILWFSIFVRIRIMRQEDAIVSGLLPPLPTPTNENVNM